MHYSVLVITPTKDHIDDQISQLLAPYNEDNEEGETHWDWYVVGGRWCGELIGYKPYMDKKWYRPCGSKDPMYERMGLGDPGFTMCGGTGSRPGSEGILNHIPDKDGDCCPFPIKEGATGCNGCHGTGMEYTFAADHRIEQDTLRLKDIRKDISTYAVVTPDGKWVEQNFAGFGEEAKAENARWKEEFTKLISQYVDTHYGTIVDIHG